jgi:hypothetical protein
MADDGVRDGEGIIAQEWQPSVNPWIIAAVVMLPTFMEILDTTIVSVALPHIAGSLSASTDEATFPPPAGSPDISAVPVSWHTASQYLPYLRSLAAWRRASVC